MSDDVLQDPAPPEEPAPFGASLQPWSSRRQRQARWTAFFLLLIPLVAVVVSVRVVGNSPEQLVGSAGRAGDDGIAVRAVVRGIDPVQGEMSVRLAFAPLGTYAGADGLTEPVRVLVFRTTGSGLLEFSAGQPMQPVDVALALDGSRVTRYPLDRYDADLAVVALDEDGDAVPASLEVFANVGDFDLSARRPTLREPTDARLEIHAERGWSTLSWVLILTVVFWLLGLGAASITWLVVVASKAVPVWSWGYLAGMLFALPGLRATLPGNPRLGALVDWAAFYWSITLVVLSMTTLLIVWNSRHRAGRDDAV